MDVVRALCSVFLVIYGHCLVSMDELLMCFGMRADELVKVVP